MCRIVNFFLLQRLKGSISGDARDGDASWHQVFFLQGKAPKEIHAILKETLGEHASSYTTVKNWVAQFKRGDFPPVIRLALDDTKQSLPRRLLIKFKS